MILPTGSFGNEPFGSPPEPGADLIASILLLPPGEVPEGPARADQDTATPVRSESERLGPVRETGVTGNADQKGIGPQRLPFDQDR